MSIHSLNEIVSTPNLVIGDIVAYAGQWWQVTGISEGDVHLMRRPDGEPVGRTVQMADKSLWRLGARADIDDASVATSLGTSARYKPQVVRAPKSKPDEFDMDDNGPDEFDPDGMWADFDKP